MALLDTVKTAKRIKHDKLDAEITRLISAAKAEMIRAGVSETKAKSDDDLITQAIVTYCLMEMSAGDVHDKYERSWGIQVDQLRKSEDYKCTTTSSSSEA